MALTGVLIVAVSLVAAVLLFAFYIFPDIICSARDTNTSAEENDTKDPVGEFCQAVR